MVDITKANISDLSREEEARLLNLADIALHNPTPPEIHPAGSRAKEDHRRLIGELQREAERVQPLKRAV